MAKDPEDPDDPRGPRPPFLDLLDSDPERAGRLFYRFFMRAVKARPPTALKYFPPDDHEDALQSVLVEFFDRNFRRLRMYKDVGNPFVGWMYLVTNRLLFAKLKEIIKTREIEQQISESDPQPVTDPEPIPDTDGVIKVLRSALDALGYPCDTLIKAKFVDGMTNQEIARLFPELRLNNRQVDDKIRTCLRALRRNLEDRGFDRNAFQDYF